MPDAVGPVAAGCVDIGLVVAGMWLVGSAAVPNSPAAERLAAGLLLVVGAAWLLMAQPLIGGSLVGHALVLRLLAAGAVIAAVALRRPQLRVEGVRPVTLARGDRRDRHRLSGVADADRSARRQRHPVARGVDPPGGRRSDRADEPLRRRPERLSVAAARAGWPIMQGFGAGMATTLLVLEAVMLLGLGLGAWLLARELRLSEAAASWAVVLALGRWRPRLALVTRAGRGADRRGRLAARTSRRASRRSSRGSPATAATSCSLPRRRRRSETCRRRSRATSASRSCRLRCWLFLRALRRRSPATGVAAGAAFGFVVLMSPIAAAVALVCVVVLSFGAPVRAVGAAIAAAAAVVALWLVPLGWHYHELGGFINTTRAPPETVGASAAAVTLAVWWCWRRSGPRRGRPDRGRSTGVRSACSWRCRS